jgi:hypothetical protein
MTASVSRCCKAGLKIDERVAIEGRAAANRQLSDFLREVAFVWRLPGQFRTLSAIDRYDLTRRWDPSADQKVECNP